VWLGLLDAHVDVGLIEATVAIADGIGYGSMQLVLCNDGFNAGFTCLCLGIASLL